MASIDDRRWIRRDGKKFATGYTGAKPWQVRTRVWDDEKGRRVEVTKSFARKLDAEQYLHAQQVAINDGSFVNPNAGRETFKERYDRWLAGAVNLRPSTRARDESYARSLILPTFGHRPMASIDSDDVQKWIAGLIKAGKSPATTVKAHQIATKIAESAVKAKVIARNPFRGAELPRIEREEARFLTPSEAEMLAAAIDPRFRCLVLLGAYGGLRIGELLGLRAGRIDLMRARVEVAEIVTDVKGAATAGPPKTKASRRSVPLPRFVVDEVSQLVAELEPTDLLFPDAKGAPMRASNFRRRVWKPAMDATKLEPFTPHALRHSAVAFWIEAGAKPNEIARRAGHASVVTVLTVYGHLLPQDEDTVTDALDAMARKAVEEAKAKAEQVADVVPLRRHPQAAAD